MTIHKCDKCDYETKYVSHLRSHLRRKTPCDKDKKKTLKKSNIGSKKSKKSGSVGSEQKKSKIVCDSCSKNFVKKSNLNRHINLGRCNMSNDVNMKIKILEEKLEKLENKPNVVNINNNINNIYINVPMNDFAIKDVFESFFSVDEFYKGPDAIVDMLYETLFQKNIKLLDIARQIFQYKTEDKVIKDIKNYKVLSKIAGYYKKHVKDFVRYETMRHNDDMDKIEEIMNTGMKHQKAIDNLNHWSGIWVKTIGQ
jgi:hypothetical protein